MLRSQPLLNVVQCVQMGYQELSFGRDVDEVAMFIDRRSLVQQARDFVLAKLKTNQDQKILVDGNDPSLSESEIT